MYRLILFALIMTSAFACAVNPPTPENSCVRGFTHIADFSYIRTIQRKDIQRVPWTKLKNTQKVRKNEESNPLLGTGVNYGIRAEYEGQQVFVKVSKLTAEKPKDENTPRSTRDLAREAAWNEFLRVRGVLAPTIYGITMTEDGYYGLVSDFIAGIHFPASPESLEKQVKSFPAAKVTETTKEDIQNAFSVLRENNIYLVDPQFRINSEGRAYLIDLEFARPFPSNKSMRRQQEREMANQEHDMLRMLQELKKITTY